VSIGEEQQIQIFKRGLAFILGEMYPKTPEVVFKYYSKLGARRPFEIIKGLKLMINDPIIKQEDYMNEIEIEPRVRKVFLANLPIIAAVVKILSFILVLIELILPRAR